MGFLVIDHRDGFEPDGSKGRLQEYDTVSCKHCQALIRIVLKGVTKAYETPYRCDRCNGPICRYCGEARKGICTPFPALVERAIRIRKALEWREYHYRACMKG